MTLMTNHVRDRVLLRVFLFLFPSQESQRRHSERIQSFSENFRSFSELSFEQLRERARGQTT
jgi:hypothetical protein